MPIWIILIIAQLLGMSFAAFLFAKGWIDIKVIE